MCSSAVSPRRQNPGSGKHVTLPTSLWGIMHLKARDSDKQICRACIPQLQHLHHRLEGFPGSQQASPSDFQQTCLKMFLSYV